MPRRVTACHFGQATFCLAIFGMRIKHAGLNLSHPSSAAPRDFPEDERNAILRQNNVNRQKCTRPLA
ncbi:hypothetical protein ECG_00647 [Echinococcus granulosus]|uniref:Transposase n=1 Tax=Echinococcus granulosus TaxID=6210 RepID=A0A068W8Z4_ECHGR|nr:hypothetical protein ECG_00647 [Echinococcus granulosus]CDS16498.1 hypothetical protein EgrG_000892400 [Echinococcus granulosus]